MGGEVAFREVAQLIRDVVHPEEAGKMPYIGLEHIEQGTLRLAGWGHASDVSSAKFRFRKGDILFGKLRPYFRKVIRAPFDGICSTDIWVVRAKEGFDQNYLFYWMAAQDFVDFASKGSEGTRMPRAKWEHVERFKRPYLPLPEQRAIARILGTLDDKIELNRRMNETLEAMAQALFKSWFVDFDPVVVNALRAGNPIPEKFAERAAHYRNNPGALGLPEEILRLFPARFVDSELGPIPEGWEVKALDEIAHFQNGLALQKYRPKPGEGRLPAVKIAQLRSGRADSGEWASANIRPECIIDDGDVIFSWSGSLLLTIWCGGRAALNQHLFKVTSDNYPKWFYFHWIGQHLPEFIHIASGKATTMGHIKRRHLSEALCVIPGRSLMDKAHSQFDRILTKKIENELESRTLADLRDTLLPKLISGELRVPDVEKLVHQTT